VLAKKDRSKAVELEMNRYVAFIHRVADAHLVIVCRKSAKPSSYRQQTHNAVLMLEKGSF
jgi:hypothetical protein